MSETALPSVNINHLAPSLNAWLSNSIKAWIGIVLVGQWMFALYIFAQFTIPWVTGNFDEAQTSHMIRGYKSGETFNNGVLLFHLIPVMLISLSATFQLFPYVRKQYPTFHRINGRVFLAFGLIGAITGLYMTWVVGSRLSVSGSLGVTLNGILIPVFVYLAWRAAVQRKFSDHRRFAVHAFILINGVWTVRLYMMGWFMVNQGPVGNSSTLDGPADIALSFASFLLPMAIAEMVFWAERKAKPKVTLGACVGVSLMVLITLVGVIAASMMMWIPRISAAFLG